MLSPTALGNMCPIRRAVAAMGAGVRLVGPALEAIPCRLRLASIGLRSMLGAAGRQVCIMYVRMCACLAPLSLPMVPSSPPAAPPALLGRS